MVKLLLVSEVLICKLQILGGLLLENNSSGISFWIILKDFIFKSSLHYNDSGFLKLYDYGQHLHY